MLLVHGLGGSHANWLSVGPVLAGRHRVLAVDLPGFGLSPAAGRRSTMSKAGAEAVVRSVLRTCTVDLDRIDPAVLEAHVALEQQRIAHPGWHEPLHDALGSLLRTLAERSTVQRWIRRVTVPTLLTH